VARIIPRLTAPCGRKTDRASRVTVWGREPVAQGPGAGKQQGGDANYSETDNKDRNCQINPRENPAAKRFAACTWLRPPAKRLLPCRSGEFSESAPLLHQSVR
jgi:hypothetical protein